MVENKLFILVRYVVVLVRYVVVLVCGLDSDCGEAFRCSVYNHRGNLPRILAIFFRKGDMQIRVGLTLGC